ncbi:hypothetical protein, partial [Staphylococcus aureus]|uniref:hypothetical protein n=1 Tax=Staphylococcus aureus TaxID=1280 RepID=UPI001A9331C6
IFDLSCITKPGGNKRKFHRKTRYKRGDAKEILKFRLCGQTINALFISIDDRVVSLLPYIYYLFIKSNGILGLCLHNPSVSSNLQIPIISR